jgi:filamentous hemagglutinin
MKALALANAAINLKQAGDAIAAGQGQVPTGKTLPDGTPEMVDGNAANKAGGIGISVTLGSSRSQSNQSNSSDSARGSSVTAGGDINISASGAGANSDITIQGSEVKAGGTARLSAEDEVKLLAAANTQRESNSQSSRSGSIGVGIQLGAGGAQMGVTVSASAGKGQGSGDGTSYTNTQVSGQSVQIESGGDTTLKGAVVKADQVTANVGGNLSIDSQQNSSQYRENSQQIGGSVTFGPAPGASLSAGQTKINSNYQSVGEQSAIRAGDGGFQVNVGGNTTLAGGQITSSDKAVQDGKNTFSTGGSLSTSDLNNSASFEASSVSVGVGAGTPKPGASLSAGLSGVGIGSDSGSASSTTTAAISGIAGNTAARTGDAETGIKPIFNKDEARREVNAQVAITQEFGKQASKMVGDYAKEQHDKAKAAGDKEGMAAWAEGGKNRVALHVLVGGLTGGVQGALGAGAASAAAPKLEELQEGLRSALTGAGVGEEAAKLIASLAGGATAATIGGAAGGTAGAATAFNADMNNRQLHDTEKAAIKRAAMGNNEKEERLTKAACYQIKCWAEFPEGSLEREKNYVSVIEAANLQEELAWVNAQKSSNALFQYSEWAQAKDAFKAEGVPNLKNGGKVVGGSLAVITGKTICGTTGIGCVAGGPLAVFGASEAIEGGTGLYNSFTGAGTQGFNPVRKGLNLISPTWGDTAYDGGYLLFSIGTLGANVPLKVGASDGINRAKALNGSIVTRWQNPVINPLNNRILLPQKATQGVLLYGIGTKVPAVIEDVNKAKEVK